MGHRIVPGRWGGRAAADHRPPGYREIDHGRGAGRILGAPVLGHDWAMSGLRPYPELQEALDRMGLQGAPRCRLVAAVGPGALPAPGGLFGRARRRGAGTGGGRHPPGGACGGSGEPRGHDVLPRRRAAPDAGGGPEAPDPRLVRVGLGPRGARPGVVGVSR